MTTEEAPFNPMLYDALLELSTRIRGRYLAWAREAATEHAAQHWRDAGIEVHRQVDEVDWRSKSAIEAKRTELRALFASMPTEAPEIEP